MESLSLYSRLLDFLRCRLPREQNFRARRIMRAKLYQDGRTKLLELGKKNYSLVGIMGNPEKVRAQKAGYNALFMKDPAS